jgi:hypothetical protein
MQSLYVTGWDDGRLWYVKRIQLVSHGDNYHHFNYRVESLAHFRTQAVATTSTKRYERKF